MSERASGFGQEGVDDMFKRIVDDRPKVAILPGGAAGDELRDRLREHHSGDAALQAGEVAEVGSLELQTILTDSQMKTWVAAFLGFELGRRDTIVAEDVQGMKEKLPSREALFAQENTIKLVFERVGLSGSGKGDEYADKLGRLADLLYGPQTGPVIRRKKMSEA